MELLLLFVGMIVVVIILSVVGSKFSGQTNAQLLDADPRERLERKYAAEFEDMDNLLDAHNHRRAKRGLPPQTEEEYDLERRKQERQWRRLDNL